MRRGEFTAAWQIDDWLRSTSAVTNRSDLPRHVQTVWDGTSPDGRRVLLRCYHGLGDTLQFIRYVPRLRERVSELIVWAQPSLMPLLQGVEGIDRLIALHDGDPDVAYDVSIEIMELPYLFRTTLDDLPATVPYLTVDRQELDRRLGPAVGLVWRAGDWAAHRSVPFAELEPLVHTPVTWYVLQGQPGIEERPDGFGTPAGTTDIVEAARVIRSLDLLITVDSMPAHLAGALGTPVWTLLPANADWRWMAARDDSPWYPTMRLFRQERQGEWGPVVGRVARALNARFRLRAAGAQTANASADCGAPSCAARRA